jgi:hypothetical protein
MCSTLMYVTSTYLCPSLIYAGKVKKALPLNLNPSRYTSWFSLIFVGIMKAFYQSYEVHLFGRLLSHTQILELS